MKTADLPRITVVTPSLNQAPFLEAAMASVFDQDYPNLEYMVIDGGSTDGSRELLERHGSRLAHWVSEPDRGQSHAINKGFERATGDLLAWLNADDFYLPGALHALATAFREADDPSAAGFLFGRGIRVDREGNFLGDFWPHAPAFDLSALRFGFDYILQPATIMVRSALEKTGFLDEELHWCMDYDLWLRLGANFRAVPVDHPVAASREYAETKSLSGGLDRIAEISRVVERHAGIPFTPGVLYYLSDVLRRIPATEAGGLFGPDVRRCLELLHEEALAPLSVFGRRSPGFPERAGTEDGRERMRRQVANREGFLVRLENDLGRLHRETSRRDEELRELGGLLEICEADRAARLAVIEARDGRIAELDGEMTELSLHATELDRRMTEAESQLAEALADAHARTLRVAELESQLAATRADAETQTVRAHRAETALAELRNRFPVRLLRKFWRED